MKSFSKVIKNGTIVTQIKGVAEKLYTSEN